MVRLQRRGSPAAATLPASAARFSLKKDASRHTAGILLQINYLSGPQAYILMLGVDDNEVLRKCGADLLAYELRYQTFLVYIVTPFSNP